tara:strand:+ start:347 stop:658 length:312 start_codon:yes stop_codon:yes gene_type:complete
MNTDIVKEQITDVLKTVYDPEIPVNIYEMGLIYEIDIQQDGMVNIKMTLTSPNCPAAQSLPAEVETKVKAIDEVLDASIEIVWEPAWHIDMMTEDAKLELGID